AKRRRHPVCIGLVTPRRISHVIDDAARAQLSKGRDDACADTARAPRDQRHLAREVEGVFHSHRLVWCLRNTYTFVALKLAWGEARRRECIPQLSETPHWRFGEWSQI